MLTDDRRAALADLVHASDAMRAIPAYLLGAALLETLLSLDERLALLSEAYDASAPGRYIPGPDIAGPAKASKAKP